MPAQVRQISFSASVGIRLVAFLYTPMMWTMRIRLSPRAQELVKSKPAGCLFLIWHNRILLALSSFYLRGKGIPLTGLVSASGDGAILATAMQAFGVQPVRGSSSRRAVEATRELLASLDSGRNAVITPDGPRGPVYTIKPGTAQIGGGHAKAIYLFGFNCNRCWFTKSWDRFNIPKPFAIIEVDVERVEASDEVNVELLRSKMLELNRSSEKA